ncbi:MAG: efflux RND transporter periplasmic adaptor subunit [Burkholderiales bacterium]|nr:efflux RND transporter periplasmic adaptor subunit [Burkholderiales bacterium]
MKTRTLLVSLGLVALAGAVWFGLARQRAGAPAKTPTPTSQSAPAATIEFAATDLLVLVPTRIARGIPITGSLRPTQQSLVRAKVAGELRDLLVREGVSVQAGQVIARIDTADFEWRIKEREAQLRAAQAQVEQAQRVLTSNQQLFDKGFISQSALDGTRSNSDVALGTRDAAEAQLTIARKALADTAVVTPISGVVAERFVQPGEKVSPDNRIVSIVDLSRIEIEALVPASEISNVRTGQSVTLQVEGIAAPQTGKVVRISPTTSTGTRSVPVYIGLENRSGDLRAGLFAQGSLALETHADVLVVPAAAVREAAGRTFVYAIDNGRLVERTVVTGLRDDSARAANGSIGVIEIRDGLKPADRIVAVNLGALRPGAEVRSAVRPAAPAAPAGATVPATR